MNAHTSGKQGETLNPDEWIVPDLDLFQFVVDHDPPRPFSYWTQIAEDLRHWKPVALIASLPVAAALTYATGEWLFLPVGVILFGLWVVCLRIVVLSYRNDPIHGGVVHSWKPHKNAASILTGTVRLADGDVVSVGLDRQFAPDLEEGQEPFEVLFLRNPKHELEHVIAYRRTTSPRPTRRAAPS